MPNLTAEERARLRQYARDYDANTLASMLIAEERLVDAARRRAAAVAAYARDLLALVVARMRQNSKGEYAEWSDGSEVSPSFRLVLSDLDAALKGPPHVA